MILFLFAFPVSAQTEDDSIQSFDEQLEELSAELESLTASIEAQTEEISRISISGETKVRLRNTYSDVSHPIGAYGETLEKGQKLNHRMILEVEARINQKLSAGGMLRLSNEDEIVFTTGPERLSSDRGSAFVKYNPRNLRATLGYYDIHFTPLTLMRWHIEDNPESGGTSGCACPSTGGAITSEGLEELGPDLTFEGGKVNADIGDNIDFVALLAIPRIAEEGKTYRQHLYGTNVRFRAYHKPSTSFRWLGITAVSIHDDETSVTEPMKVPYEPIKNKVYSIDFNLPISLFPPFSKGGKGGILLLKGEFALSGNDWNLFSEDDKITQRYATILGMSIKYPQRLLTKISYLRINPKYESFYKALSYASNRHGFRLSSNYEIVKDKLSIWMFYKRIQELESIIKPERLLTLSTISCGTSITPIKKILIRANYILQLSRRDEHKPWSEVHNTTQSINIDFTYDLARENSLTCKYQYIIHQDKTNPPFDYHANIISILASTKF